MKQFYIGGQAVIDGVMMKYRDNIAVAVRKHNGKIIVKKEKLKFKESTIPLIRGIYNLFIMLYIGYKSLGYSGNINLKKEEKFTFKEFFITFLFAFVFAILLFKFIPLFIANFFLKQFNLNNFYFNLIDGFFKIGLFVLYVYLMSLNKDIRTVFQYHGAEHKVVNAYESNVELTVKNVQKFTTIHKRCGTTFVFLVLFVSIIIYMFIPKDYSFLIKLLLRILLLPIIASLSYEILRLGARYNFLRILITPGMLIQRITTKEPNDKQVQVAIASVKAVI